MLEQLQANVGPLDLVTTPLGGVVGHYTGRGVGAAMNRLQELGRSSAPERAYADALNLGNENVTETGAEVKRARRQGVPSTFMDVGRPASRALAKKALILGSSRADDTLEAIDRSRGEARDRVYERINKSLKPLPYFEHEDRLKSELYTNAKPLYENAYLKYPGIPESSVPAFKEIFDAPDGQKAVKVALRLLRNQGKTIGKVDAVGLVHKPSLEFLDYVKRGFDQIISKEEAQGPTALGRSMRELRNRLRDQLDAVAPEYKAARAQYAGDLEVLDALRIGRNDFLKMQPTEIQQAQAGMSAAERRALRTGVSQRLYELIHDPRSDINPATIITKSPQMANRVNLLFDKDSERRVFRSALEREAELFLRQRAMVNQGEAGRMTRLSRELDKPRPYETSLMGKFTSLFNSTPGFNLDPEQADEVVEILRRGTPAEVDATIRRMAPIAARRKGYGTRKRNLGRLGAGLGAVLAPFLNDETELPFPEFGTESETEQEPQE
jgi:hypothetical protein